MNSNVYGGRAYACLGYLWLHLWLHLGSEAVGQEDVMVKESGRRTAGDGALYQRADGMWCASLDLGWGPDGKRKRWVGRSMDKAKALAKLREARAELSAAGSVSRTSAARRHPR